MNRWSCHRFRGKTGVLFLCILFFCLPHVEAQSSFSFNPAWVKYINKKPLSLSKLRLKLRFPTPADHKAIDSALNLAERSRNQWKWEKHTQGLAFIHKKKIRFIVNKIEKDSLVVNGKNLQLTPNLSYLQIKDQFIQVIKNGRKNALRNLWLKKAHANPLVFGAIGLVALFSLVVQAAEMPPLKNHTKCIDSRTPESYQPANSLAKENFKPYGSCVRFFRGEMPEDYSARIRMVAKNFDKGNMESRFTKPSPYTYSCMSEAKQVGVDKENALQVCRCISRKQKYCSRGGWNMTKAMAKSTCLTAFALYKSCKDGKDTQTQAPPMKDQPIKEQPISAADCGKDKNCKQELRFQGDTPKIPNESPMNKPDASKSDR